MLRPTGQAQHRTRRPDRPGRTGRRGKYYTFDGGSIYWTATTGAHPVWARSATRGARWDGRAGSSASRSVTS
ncbi:hypothetical protein QOM21_34635 [Streptomyces sp. Pv4-95]|uniref:hypothetical protein n=1 Tax=Streptomyces sp. Pv4-95 TaxID=3049543 RepID=UPI0038924483